MMKLLLPEMVCSDLAPTSQKPHLRCCPVNDSMGIPCKPRKDYVMQLERFVVAMSTVYSGRHYPFHLEVTLERLCVYSIRQKSEADDATKYIQPSRWHGRYRSSTLAVWASAVHHFHPGL